MGQEWSLSMIFCVDGTSWHKGAPLWKIDELVLGLATDAGCYLMTTSPKALLRYLGVGSRATSNPKNESAHNYLYIYIHWCEYSYYLQLSKLWCVVDLLFTIK